MIRSSRLFPALMVAAGMVLMPVIAPPPALAADEVAAPSADAIAEAYAALLARDYVYPETGERYAAAIRAGIAAGRYRALTGDALGAAVDADVNAVAPDGHLRLRTPEGATAPPAAPGGAVPAPRPKKVPVAGGLDRAGHRLRPLQRLSDGGRGHRGGGEIHGRPCRCQGDHLRHPHP